ncbi:hypothetical protein [Peptoniphilus timonensis]|uniref:hypothetical protein n=1 Tax=Peptoniphilus timonensis TaxID=1268254 RepID=UPI00030F987B|nr:hypothetical protein [Peptoniphilus timonensis]
MGRKCKRIFVENRTLLLINFGVLCFLCGSIIRKYRKVDMGIWGYMLSILTNHYYILYCVFPILLIIIARHIRNVNDIEMIRYRNAFQQIKMSTKSFIQWLMAYMVLHLVITFVIGIRTFDLSIHTQNIKVETYDELINILNTYIEYFSNSLFAVISNVVYFLFGFTVLISLLSYINYRYKYRNVILSSVLIYILTFIGFKTELKAIIPIVCFDNFILLHHGLFVNGSAKFLLTILFGVLVIQFCFGRMFKVNKYGFKEFIISKKEKYISALVVLVLFLLELLRKIGNVDFNFKDVIIMTLFGTNEKYVSFIPWLRITILYLIPLFFIGIADSRIKKYGQAPILIRTKSKLSFEHKLIGVYMNYIFLYTLFVYALGSVFYFMGGAGTLSNEYFISEFNIKFTYGILSMYFVIFLVNLTFDFVIFKILCKFANGIVSFLAILFFKFFFFMLPTFNLFDLNFGLSNLFDGINNKNELVIKVATICVLNVIFFAIINMRRIRHGNYQD